MKLTQFDPMINSTEVRQLKKQLSLAQRLWLCVSVSASCLRLGLRHVVAYFIKAWPNRQTTIADTHAHTAAYCAVWQYCHSD